MVKIHEAIVREITIREMECPYCGVVWQPRVENPKQCPYCHRYFNPADKSKGRGSLV